MERADNNWTTDIEKLIKEWGDTANTLDHRFDSQSRRQMVYYILLMVPIVLCNACLSGLSIYNVIEDQIVVKIIIVILTIIGTAAISFAALFRFDTSSSNSSIISKKYKRLKNKLAAELTKDRADRMDGLKFLEYARKKYSRLGESSPDINSSIKAITRHFFIGRRGVEPPTINITAPNTTYVSPDEAKKIHALDPDGEAVLGQFIEDNINNNIAVSV